MIEARTPHHQVLGSLALHARSYLEIGVQEGNSVAEVVRRNRRIDVTLCDTWGAEHGGTRRGSHEHVDRRLSELKHHGSRRYLDGRSEDQLPLLVGQTFDVVHVDGDHSLDGALTDLRLTWPLTSRWLVLHDAFFQPVRDALFSWLGEIRIGERGATSVPHLRGVTLSMWDHGTFILEKR